MLLNITAGPDITLHEISEASTLVQNEADEEANIIFGTVIDNQMGEEVRITVIATGFDHSGKKRQGLTNVSHLSSYKQKEDLSMPTFMRKEKPVNPTVVKMGIIEDGEDSNLEIPAFLRKQAD